ncbi:hypothetical protein ACE0DR_25255 [Azotobacter sp. CWF10]
MHVLAVEDQPEVLEYLRRMLEEAGRQRVGGQFGRRSAGDCWPAPATCSTTCC